MSINTVYIKKPLINIPEMLLVTYDIIHLLKSESDLQP